MPPLRLHPLTCLCLPEGNPSHPRKKSRVEREGMARLRGWEEGRVMSREGCGWAWLDRREAGGHLPGGSALRPEWGWVLCGVGRSLIHYFGPKQDAGLDDNFTLSHRGAGGAEGKSPQPLPAPIYLTCSRDLQASLKTMEFPSKGS